MAASGMPYQCSMLVVPNLMSSQALVSSTPAWCAMRSPTLCASSSIASMMSRSMPRILMPSAPCCFSDCTRARASRGIAHAAEHRIDEDARRGEFALGALLAEFERALGVAAHVADGGDAAGQPDVEFVFQRLRLAAALLLQVGVRVDQAGQDVLAGGVDHGVGLRRPARSACGGDGVERDDVGDHIVLDDDILGTAGRRPVAIDHDGVVDQQAAHAFAIDRRLRHGGAGEREHGEEDEQGSGHGNDCGTPRASGQQQAAEAVAARLETLAPPC